MRIKTWIVKSILILPTLGMLGFVVAGLLLRWSSYNAGHKIGNGLTVAYKKK